MSIRSKNIVRAKFPRVYEYNHPKSGTYYLVDGHRTTDLDIATLSVACSWAARCGLITANPIERHHRYVDSRTVRHAKEVSFKDMTEAHAWAGNMFADPRSGSAG